MQPLLHTNIIHVLAVVVSLVMPFSSLEPKTEFTTSGALVLHSYGRWLPVRPWLCAFEHQRRHVRLGLVSHDPPGFFIWNVF